MGHIYPIEPSRRYRRDGRVHETKALGLHRSAGDRRLHQAASRSAIDRGSRRDAARRSTCSNGRTFVRGYLNVVTRSVCGVQSFRRGMSLATNYRLIENPAMRIPTGIARVDRPKHLPFEIGHALTRSERRKRILPPEGWQLWNAIIMNPPTLISPIPLMQRVFEISSLMRIGLYDCLYAALAEQEICDLLTADKLIQNLPNYPITSLSAL